MASIPSPVASVPTPVPITCVQPGGGWIVRLELAWGRFRRNWLRKRRPDYVQAMAAKRQGQCPNCPHDIVDPRDLKFFRNVCGYWFREEDDPFRWRGQLGLARMGLAEIVVSYILLLLLGGFLVILAALIGAGLLVLMFPMAVFWAFLLFFFRDPERVIPTDPDALVSPADGTITDVGEVAEPEFPGGRAFRIGMFLSVFNVHVNRLPRSGKVVNLRYFPGAFLDARHPECGVRNEQLWIDLQDAQGGRPVRVKQIAGKIARRIVCWLKLGETVRSGERLGMIKFGSRTEVYLPVDAVREVLVKVGDAVQGGSTILARCKSSG
jgi:phosphatidylserine decarboxylase